MIRTFHSAAVLFIIAGTSPVLAQDAVTWGKWADNPSACADPAHYGILTFEGFTWNKLVCKTQASETFWGGEKRAMVCDVGTHKDLSSLMVFTRTSETTLQFDMNIMSDPPAIGGVTMYRCPVGK